MPKHNPKELFVISAITRSVIAAEINEYVNDWMEDGEFSGWRVLKPNDPRLTATFCKKYADYQGKIIDCACELNTDAANDYECEVTHQFAEVANGQRKLSAIDAEWEDE